MSQLVMREMQPMKKDASQSQKNTNAKSSKITHSLSFFNFAMLSEISLMLLLFSRNLQLSRCHTQRSRKQKHTERSQNPRRTHIMSWSNCHTQDGIADSSQRAASILHILISHIKKENARQSALTFLTQTNAKDMQATP